MSILKKPYEIFLQTNNQIYESIGSNTSIDQGRAFNPKWVCNINGSHTLTFTVYYNYIDTVSGESTSPSWISYLRNEAKVKLNYDDKDYEMIIKNIKKDNSKKTYEVTAVDAFINELSKNGFNLTFDAKLNNNVGTIQTLAKNTLEENTDWKVPALGEVLPNFHDPLCNTEFIADRFVEDLVCCQINGDLIAKKIIDSSSSPSIGSDQTITNATIYIFYSCLKDKSPIFQFLYKSNNTYNLDDEYAVIDKDSQYIKEVDPQTFYGSFNNKYGLAIPLNMAPSGSYIYGDNYMRGRRYNYAPDIEYNEVLEQYVTTYTKDTTQYKGYKTTDYCSPILVQDFVTNGQNMTETSGWSIAKLRCRYQSYYNRGSLKIDAKREHNGTTFTVLDDLLAQNITNENIDSYKYNTYLTYTRGEQHTEGSSQTPTITYCDCLVNSGLFDNRVVIETLGEDEYRFEIKYKYNDSESTSFLTLCIGNFPYHVVGGFYEVNPGLIIEEWSNETTYSKDDYVKVGNSYYKSKKNNNINRTVTNTSYWEESSTIYTPQFSDLNYIKAIDGVQKTYLFLPSTGNEYHTISCTMKIQCPLSKKDYKKSKVQFFIFRRAYSTSDLRDLEIEYCKFYKAIKDDSNNYITPDSPKIEPTIIETYHLYKTSDLNDIANQVLAEDGHPKTLDDIQEIKIDSKNWDNSYTTVRNLEKRRSITIKESNYFNIIQTLCETFQCWAYFYIGAEGKYVFFHNYIGQPNYAGFKYGVNLKSISRSDDSKQLVTKLIVKNNNNKYGENGFCTIQRAGSNPTGENFILKFDYFLEHGLLDSSEYLTDLYNLTNASGSDGSWNSSQQQFISSALSIDIDYTSIVLPTAPTAPLNKKVTSPEDIETAPIPETIVITDDQIDTPGYRFSDTIPNTIYEGEQTWNLDFTLSSHSGTASYKELIYTPNPNSSYPKLSYKRIDDTIIPTYENDTWASTGESSNGYKTIYIVGGNDQGDKKLALLLNNYSTTV